MSLPRLTLALATCVAVLALGAAPAMAKELRVDDDGAQCPNATFTSIQAAVTAASPGDKIKVCPGTYREQVRIDNKDGLKLESLNPLQAIIEYPPVLTQPSNNLVHIIDSDDVDLRGFTIKGPYPPVSPPGACAEPLDRHRGVYVDNSQDVHIFHNHITLIRNSVISLLGCQDGIAVQIGRQFESSIGTGRLDHNLIDEYEKGGVVVDNAGSDAEIDHNTIKASDEVQAHAAPNGVQISREASGTVDHNTISENLFLGNKELGSGAGILLFDPAAGGVKVDHNEAFNNDDNIALIDADGEEISHNILHHSAFFDGLFVDEDSEGNRIKNNRAFQNAEHDCHDDSAGGGTAGTANEWKNNRGATQNRPGLCRP